MQISSLYSAYSAAALTSSIQGTAAPAAARQYSSQTAQDRINLSPEGLAASKKTSEKQTDAASTEQAIEAKQSALTAEELKQLSQLKSRDREVRAHEQAHLSVAGQHAAGGASFTLERGPDGNSYAVGGEVPIDVSSESTPEATIQKMQTIRRAALAPADPSSADRQIAAQASAKEMQARREKATELQKNLSGLISSDQMAKNKKDNLSLSSGTSAHETTGGIMFAA